jgi:hypothetical protein
MAKDNFIFLNVPGLLATKENPPTGRIQRVMLAACTAKISFFKETGLLRRDSPMQSVAIEEVVLRLSDMTLEGQDFVLSGATSKWLGAVDRKAAKLGSEGATEEEQLAVYRDTKGLYSRLVKFRKERPLRKN